MTRQVFEVEAPYKFTMPIEKAETRADGIYLVGLASGPEVDSQNERVHPSLIAKWADQINTGAITVMYRDWHQKDTSLEDLGQVTKAWVDDDNHLGVEVKLDEDHPTAVFIHKKAASGKKFGMSVFGKVISYADEFEKSLGRTVRTFYDATLDEVSNTTRPVWTPSFGSVLAKAVMDTAKGDTQLSNGTDEAKEQAVVDETQADENAKNLPAADSAEAVAVPAADDADETVEKAISTSTKKDEKSLADIVKTYNTLGEKLRSAGLLNDDSESDNATATETTVTKSEQSTESKEETKTVAPTVETLSKALVDLTGIVSALADRIPDGSAPGVLVKAEPADPLAELSAVTDPIERMRLGFAALHGGQVQR